MNSLPRPMLASNEVVDLESLDRIRYPVIASPKIDAWRSFNYLGEPHTRSGKTIPNEHTRIVLSLPELNGLDGELVCGSPDDLSAAIDPNAMQRAQSAFSTHAGQPEFTWYIFDDLERHHNNYWDWWRGQLSPRFSGPGVFKLPSFCKLIPQVFITNDNELSQFVRETLDQGYEGVVTRDPKSPYKHGRSTRKQEWSLKIKEYTYEEGILVMLNERMENQNIAERDELGYLKRSGHQAGKVGANTLGSFTLRRPNSPETFNVGCGHLDAGERQRIWDLSNTVQPIITFRHFATTGVVNRPRQAQFVAFRAKEDL